MARGNYARTLVVRKIEKANAKIAKLQASVASWQTIVNAMDASDDSLNKAANPEPVEA